LPEEVAADILNSLVEAARLKYQNNNLNSAVITVPAYFNNEAKQATLDAAEIAGIKVLKIITEPAAAVIAYNYHNPIGVEKSDNFIFIFLF